MSFFNSNYQRARGIPGPGNEALVFTHNTKEIQNLEAGIPYVPMLLGQPAMYEPSLFAVVQPSAGIANSAILDPMGTQPLMQNSNYQFPPFLGG